MPLIQSGLMQAIGSGAGMGLNLAAMQTNNAEMARRQRQEEIDRQAWLSLLDPMLPPVMQQVQQQMDPQYGPNPGGMPSQQGPQYGPQQMQQDPAAMALRQQLLGASPGVLRDIYSHRASVQQRQAMLAEQSQRQQQQLGLEWKKAQAIHQLGGGNDKWIAENLIQNGLGHFLSDLYPEGVPAVMGGAGAQFTPEMLSDPNAMAQFLNTSGMSPAQVQTGANLIRSTMPLQGMGEEGGLSHERVTQELGRFQTPVAKNMVQSLYANFGTVDVVSLRRAWELEFQVLKAEVASAKAFYDQAERMYERVATSKNPDRQAMAQYRRIANDALMELREKEARLWSAEGSMPQDLDGQQSVQQTPADQPDAPTEMAGSASGQPQATQAAPPPPGQGQQGVVYRRTQDPSETQPQPGGAADAASQTQPRPNETISGDTRPLDQQAVLSVMPEAVKIFQSTRNRPPTQQDKYELMRIVRQLLERGNP